MRSDSGDVMIGTPHMIGTATPSRSTSASQPVNRPHRNGGCVRIASAPAATLRCMRRARAAGPGRIGFSTAQSG